MTVSNEATEQLVTKSHQSITVESFWLKVTKDIFKLRHGKIHVFVTTLDGIRITSLTFSQNVTSVSTTYL